MSALLLAVDGKVLLQKYQDFVMKEHLKRLEIVIF